MSKYFVQGNLLDIGCGTKPYQSLFKVERYVGMDFVKDGSSHNSNADIVYDGKKFPVESDSFQYLLATEVLEHVFNPQEFMHECHRVLKKEGLFLITVPFVWDEHEEPYDFGRYSSFGLKKICEESGFAVLEQYKTGNFITALGQMFCTYLYYIFYDKKIVFSFAKVFIFAPIQIFTLIVSRMLPFNDKFYLDNVILLKKE